MTPIQLITDGTWDHALFTTYSLSLSFYETQIHKLGLARNGCRDIRIVADLDGYQLSLSERQSHRVGNEYRLTPVVLPNGVFHPKLIWLAGKELDLLLIGSGNLTFGGFGKNLECLEVVRSDQSPGLFAQVGSLMQCWAEREDLRFADTDWLPFWIQRGVELGRAASFSSALFPSLVHSSINSIGDQILERVGEHGNVIEVCSLSPYYDPDAHGILSFAESLLAPRLTVGLLPGQEAATTFPFQHHRKTECSISAAQFSAPGEPTDQRRLHAKILEIRMEDGSSFLVTGSVNSTRKSLMTADNIETAILRHYPPTSERPFTWEPCDIPASSQRLEFNKAGLGGRVLVSGKLTGEGRIEGCLICRDDPAGEWQAVLQRIDGTSGDLSLPVDSAGRFSKEVDNLELFQHAAGLQLHVEREGHQGTGWVSVEGLLMAARRGFLSPSTLLRLLGDDADESDETELLRYLVASAQRHLSAFSSNRTGVKSAGKGADDDAGKGGQAMKLSVDLLVATESGFGSDGTGFDGDAREDALLNTYMRRIRQNLLRLHDHKKGAEELEETGDDRASKREEQERERNRKQLVISLGEFQNQLRGLASRANVGHDRSAALCMWFEVTLPILLRRLNQPDEAELFMIQWVSQAMNGQRVQNSSDILSRHVVGTLLTLAAAELSRSEDPAKRLGRLHERLEIFCGETPPEEVCEDLELLDPVQPPLAAEILKALSSAPPLAEALDAITRTPTTRQQIDLMIRAMAEGGEWPTDLPILSLPAGKDFADQVESGRPPKVLPVSVSTVSCPHCHLALKSTISDIERDRFGTCRNCCRFLIASI